MVGSIKAKEEIKVNRRSALARALIMTDLFHRNVVMANAPSLITKDFVRIIRYHVKRLTKENKEIFKQFSFHLVFPINGVPLDLEGHPTIIIGNKTCVGVTRDEYLLDDKLQTSIAMHNLEKSGFFGLVKKVVEGN